MQWRQIKVYEGIYDIREDGLIMSLEREVTYIRNGKDVKMIKPQSVMTPTDVWGAKIVTLSKSGVKKNFRIHKLLKENFI